MKKYALYIRTTTENKEAAIQESILKKYVNKTCKKEPCEIAGVFVDECQSGKTIDRPALKKLAQDIQNNKIDTMLVSELSRLSIYTEELLNIIRWLTEMNKRLIAVNDDFDSTRPRENYIFQVTEILQKQRPLLLEEEQQLEATKWSSSKLHKCLESIKKVKKFFLWNT
ncbi:MAG: hypothetical protein DRO96_01540 [Candidatus Aenigmatarchaeota archaeon]|nr:MAG: hypothetical protein DRO96_01540 [Candidatus Aenigmarchaeota archaeon]